MTANMDFTPSRKTARARGYITDYRPQQKTVAIINDAVAVLEEYRDHWPLTCRQIFYRLVGAKEYPKSEDFYKKLCHHLCNARRAKLIPFAAIRDDGVSVVGDHHFDDQDHFLRHVRRLGNNYKRNKLTNQRHHIEVWCEAAGMIFQLDDVAGKYSIKTYSCSGFDSLTAKKNLANRICKIGKPAVILHLGDYDPSGECMFDAVASDVAAFVEADKPWGGVSVRFERVGLTSEQVRNYNLPTAPPKASDTRSAKWVGETCQLEALSPTQIAELLDAAILRLIDDDLYQEALRSEETERRLISRALPAPRRTGGAA
jgi:hypothetical protein